MSFRLLSLIISICLIFTLINLAVHQVSVEENKKVKEVCEAFVEQECGCDQVASQNFNLSEEMKYYVRE